MAQAINRYFNRQAAQPDFYQEPLDMLAVALDAKQKRYDQGLALSDELYNTSLNALPKDRAAADAIIGGYQSAIDEIVERSGGDYSQIQPDLYRLKRQIFKDFSPGGKANAIETMYGRYNAALEEGRKRIGKDVTADQLGSLVNWFGKEYQGVGEKDPVTGVYSGMMELPSLAKYVDINDLVTQYGKEIVASKLKNVKPEDAKLGEWFQKNGKIWVKNNVGIEEVTPDQVRSVLTQGLASNDEFMNYMQQMNEFGSPIDADKIDMAINRGVETFGFQNLEYDQEMKFDPEYMLRLRQSLRNQELDRFLNQEAPVDTFPSTVKNTVFDKYSLNIDDPIAKDAGYYPGVGYNVRGVRFEKPTQEKGFGTNYNKLLEILEDSPALKSVAQDIYKKVANADIKSADDKWKAFARDWDKALSNLQANSTTAIGLDATYTTKSLGPIWSQRALQGQWYKVEDDGSTTLVDKDDLDAETLKKPRLPAGIQSMGDRIGFITSDYSGNKYIVTGISDEITSTLTPVMSLYSPLITGQYGKGIFHETLPDGTTAPYDVRSSIGLHSDGSAYLKLERKDGNKWTTITEDDGTPTQGEYLLDYLQTNAAREIFRNSRLSNAYIDYMDSKRLGDVDEYDDPIKIN